MTTGWTQFIKMQIDRGAKALVDDPSRIACYDDLETEYRALRDGTAIVDRSDRTTFEIVGADRATWLHNLTTNEVRNISAGEGNYAFALNVKGRILFDLNILVQQDSILIDLDRRFADRARAHFDKYTITEEITLTDRSDEVVRFALAGVGAMEVLGAMGCSQLSAMSTLGSRKIELFDTDMTLFRHDFCGPPGVELIIPADRAVSVWESFTQTGGTPRAVPVGANAVEVHRIEVGIPRSGAEITDDLVPAETGQFDRAVSYQKGCYLGQEIVERMRSRDVLARRLCSLTFEGDSCPVADAALNRADGATIGKVTSVCRSMATGRMIGIGLIKTDGCEDGSRIKVSWPDGSSEAVVASLSSTTVSAR